MRASPRRRLGRFVRAHSAFVGSVLSVSTAAPEVVLTYDDGPDPEATAAVQEELELAGATATFFVLLTQVRRHPSVVRETVARGHEVALHGVDHRSLPGLSTDEIRRRCDDGRAELEDVVGRSVEWIRPPYGHQTLRTWRAVRSTGLQPVMWGPSLRDSVPMDQEDRLDAVLEATSAGAIVLAHDRFATSDDGADDGPPPLLDRPATTRALLARLAEEGLAARSLERALANGTVVRGAWFGS